MQTSKAADVTTSVLPSLLLEMNDSVSLSVEPTAEGQFIRSALNVDVSTNSTSGYTLTMDASSDTLTRTRLVRGETYTIDPLKESSKCEDESDDTCTGFPAGQWGYKVSNTDEAYLPMTPVVAMARQVNKTDEPTGTSYDRNTIYFGAKIDNTTPTGTYAGVNLTFRLTTNLFAGAIVYHAGNDDVLATEVENLPASKPFQIEVDESSTEVALSTSSPRRAGYAFVGWCTVKPTTDTVNNMDICEGGTKYSAGDVLTININDPLSINLYAIWSAAKSMVQFVLEKPGLDSVDIEGYFDGAKAKKSITETQTIELMALEEYTITPHYSEGYRATEPPITESGDGELKETNIYVAAITKSGSDAVVTIGADVKRNLSLSVSYTQTHIEKVEVRSGSANGTVIAEITTSGGSTGPKLTYGITYWLVPKYNDGYIYASWTQSTNTVGKLELLPGSCGEVTAQYTIGDGRNAADLATRSGVQIDSDYMQNFLEDNGNNKDLLLRSLKVGEAFTLKDSRDEQSYTVAKLADCNLWMLDNLQLGSKGAITIDYNDTNIEATSTTTNGSNKVQKAGSFDVPASSSSGFNVYDYPMINTSNVTLANKAKAVFPNSYTGPEKTGYGVYYNYCAASAGTYCYARSKGIELPNTAIDSPYDICPKGWRMPTGGAIDENIADSSEYQKLYNAYANTTPSQLINFINALRTPLPGFFDGSAVSDQGTFSYFWSSTYYNDSFMHGLNVKATSASPLDFNVRYRGYSVRCILK